MQRKRPEPQACQWAPQALGLEPLQTCALEDHGNGSVMLDDIVRRRERIEWVAQH